MQTLIADPPIATSGGTARRFAFGLAASIILSSTCTEPAPLGPPARLETLTGLPDSVFAGEPVRPAPRVRVLDGHDRPVPGTNVSLQRIAGYPYPSGVPASGATARSDSAGIAAFANLVI